LTAVSFEVCYSVDPIKVQCHRWSHAATVPSEAPDAQKGQKRVPRHERRAMVECFVNKYFLVSFEVEALFNILSFPAVCLILPYWCFNYSGMLTSHIPDLFRLFSHVVRIKIV